MNIERMLVMGAGCLLFSGCHWWRGKGEVAVEVVPREKTEVRRGGQTPERVGEAEKGGKERERERERIAKPVMRDGAPPTALAVPGREGYVFSPFNHKLIEVKGIASGTLVSDPHYPMGEGRHFLVP